MIKLHGIAASRAFRPLWVLEELGLAHEHIPQDFRDGTLRNPEYLKLNPNGRIPTLQDDDLTLWESMAINLYLASKYDKKTLLWPNAIALQGLIYQWSFWVVSEVEHKLFNVLLHRRLHTKINRDAACADRNEIALQAPFAILEQALNSSDYLLGNQFTLADLNVASVLSWAPLSRISLKAYPNLAAWLKRCLARPARKRAQVDKASLT